MIARGVKPRYELRDWHDLEGELIARARFKWRAMAKLMLEAEDGEPIEVNLNDLSEADLKWLEKARRSPSLVRERLNAANSDQ